MTAAAAAVLMVLVAARGEAAPPAGRSSPASAARATPAGPAAPAPARAAAKAPPPSAAKKEATVITSDRLDVDYGRNVATFTGNVRVKDKSGDLLSDEMVVYFNPGTRELKGLVATGRKVVIDAHDRRSQSRKAVYTAHDGRIVLTGDPRLMEGQNIYAAEKITIFKDTENIIFEPRARMTLYSGEEPAMGPDFKGLER